MERKDKKVVPLIMVYNNVRKELVSQTKRTLRENTEYPVMLFFREDGMRGHHKVEYIKLRNEMVEDIPFGWEHIVFTDDDLYFNKGWLRAMMKAYKNNPDVWVLAATKWKTHTLIEEREDISVMGRFSGGCLLMSKKVWEKCGPFEIDLKKTVLFWEKVHALGGKIAILNDEMKIIHCGVKSIINRRGRSLESEEMIQSLADRVKAKTNRDQKIY